MSDLGISGRFERAEVEAAFADFRRRGVGSHDWPNWAAIFTDDALYEEHLMGTFHGQSAISEWIVAAMADYPAMSLWIEWVGDRRRPHRLLHLEQPARSERRGTERYGFPNTTMLRTRATASSSGRPTSTTRPTPRRCSGRGWMPVAASTRRLNRALRGIDGWAPEPWHPRFRATRSQREFDAYRRRAALAVSTGDWNQWADQFADDAHYLEHHYGYFDVAGRDP